MRFLKKYCSDYWIMIKFWIFILTIAALFIGGVYFILSRSYPLAIVDYQIIAAGDFYANYRASITYYKNALDVYNEKDSAALESDEIRLEIQRAVIDGLVEDILIAQELKSQIGSAELDKITDRKIEEIISGRKIREAVEKLYGLSFEEFKERVLVPQAKREILEGRLFLQNPLVGGLDERLKEIKSKARILIFLPGFKWDGEKVIIK